MTDVVLVNPPCSSVHPWMYLPNLGLAYLASSLQKEGIDVKVLDAWYSRINKEDTIKKLEELNPKIIGFYSTSDQLRESIFLADEIKKRLDSFTILGGPHVSADPQMVYSYKSIDMAFVGEGEITFPKIVKSILKNKKQKKIVYGDVPKNLDSLPFPAYDSISFEKNSLVTTYQKCSQVLISRGCPFNCIFCKVRGSPIRFRSVDKIIEEINLLKNDYGIKSILFECSSFTLNKKQVLDICRNLRKEGMDISWSCATRCEIIDEEMIREMKKSGCYNINFGIEAGSYQIRKLIGKDVSDSTIIKIHKLCKKYRIFTGTYWMLGLPYETIGDIKKSIDFSIKLNSDFASYAPVFIYPNTKIFELAVNNGIIKKDAWYRFIEGKPSPIYLPSNLTRYDISKLLGTAYRKFYFRPSKISLLGKINLLKVFAHGEKLLF